MPVRSLVPAQTVHEPWMDPPQEGRMSDRQREEALASAASVLGQDDETSRRVLGQLWDLAFQEGRLAGLDELQDRLCVCTK